MNDNIDKEMLKYFYTQGKSYEEMTQIFKINKSELCKIIKEMISNNELVKRTDIRMKEFDIEELKDMYNEGKTYRYIGEKLGISRMTVNNYVFKLIEKGELEERYILDGKEDKVKKLHNKNMTVKEIAKELKTSEAKVNKKIAELKKAGEIKYRKQKFDNNIEELKDLYNKGIEIKEICETMNICSNWARILIKDLIDKGELIDRRKILEYRYIELYNNGADYKKIMNELHIGRTKVYSLRDKLLEENRIIRNESTKNDCKKVEKINKITIKEYS